MIMWNDGLTVQNVQNIKETMGVLTSIKVILELKWNQSIYLVHFVLVFVVQNVDDRLVSICFIYFLY